MKDLLMMARELLYSAVISDVLDEMGNFEHIVDPKIRPLDEKLKMVGIARTGMYRDVESCPEGHNPYEIEISLVDDVGPDEILVLGCGSSGRIAPWGELLSTAAQVNRAEGCLTDGYVRDILKIKEMGFCVFHGGIAPLDSKGRGEMYAYDIPIICGGAQISPGDLVFGDADGVVIVPKDMIVSVLNKAKEQVTKENHTRADLRAGYGLKATFSKYGVL